MAIQRADTLQKRFPEWARGRPDDIYLTQLYSGGGSSPTAGSRCARRRVAWLHIRGRRRAAQPDRGVRRELRALADRRSRDRDIGHEMEIRHFRESDACPVWYETNRVARLFTAVLNFAYVATRKSRPEISMKIRF